MRMPRTPAGWNGGVGEGVSGWGFVLRRYIPEIVRGTVLVVGVWVSVRCVIFTKYQENQKCQTHTDDRGILMIYLSIYLYLPTYLYLYLSIYLPIHLTIHPSMSIYLPIYNITVGFPWRVVKVRGNESGSARHGAANELGEHYQKFVNPIGRPTTYICPTRTYVRPLQSPAGRSCESAVNAGAHGSEVYYFQSHFILGFIERRIYISPTSGLYVVTGFVLEPSPKAWRILR